MNKHPKKLLKWIHARIGTAGIRVGIRRAQCGFPFLRLYQKFLNIQCCQLAVVQKAVTIHPGMCDSTNGHTISGIPTDLFL